MTTQTVSQAVEKQQSGPVTLMWSRKRHFDAVLPASVDVEAFLGTAAGALYASEKLMEYATANPDSLIIALMECAALGHMPGTDEYYLTPRKDHGRPKVLGIEGYRGVIERMYRSGAVAKVVVREVCENDEFRYVEGVDDKPFHSFGGQGGTGASFFSQAKPRGEMVGVYAYAELTTGAVSRIVLLTRDDVFAARDSGGYKPDDVYTPWNRMDGGQGHPEFKGRSMWLKTGAKRLEPWVPTSREYRASMLSASARAAELAAPRPQLPELPPSAPAVTREPVDAEIVDDPEDASSAGKQAPRPAESAAPPAEPAGEVPARPPAKIASGQAKQLDDYRQKLGCGESEEDWDQWLADLAKLAGLKTPIAAPGELYQHEAKQAIDQLKGLPDAAALRRLLDTGEAASDGQ